MKLKYLLLFNILMVVYLQPVFTQNPILEKGLHLKGILKKASKIYLSPGSSGTESTIAERFTPVFLFKTDDGERTKNGYYRVGKSPKNVDGWIHKDYIQLWNNRLAVHFTPLFDEKPALIFRNFTDATHTSYEIIKRKAISQRPISVNEPSEYDMLLPVLDIKKSESVHMEKLYRICYLEGNNKLLYTTPKPRGKTRLDLMFLVEIGEEIDFLKNEIVKAIEQVTNKSKMPNTEVRYGLMTYKDIPGSIVQKHLHLTNNYEEFLEAVKNLKQPKTFSNSPKRMYEGIYQAINGTRWTATDNDILSLRAIVLIGASRGYEYGENSVNIHRDDLVDNASKKRVRFITMKILTGDEENDMIHKAQLKAFVQGVDDGDKGFTQRYILAIM